MSSFQRLFSIRPVGSVAARRHPAMIDAAIVGQPRIRGILKRLVAGSRLPHALLLFGAEGTGKAAAALELARGAHCERPAEGACGACAGCRKTLSLSHADFTVIVPTPRGRSDESDVRARERVREAALSAVADPYGAAPGEGTASIRIEQVRDLIRTFARASFEGAWRTAVILSAHRMLPQAANALLKTLEEPPNRSMIVLTAPSPESVLPTILSRCQRWKLPPVATADVAAALEARGCDAGKARAAAAHAGGNVRRALAAAAEGAVGVQGRAYDLLLSLAGGEGLETYEGLEALSVDRASAFEVLKGAEVWLRDVLRFSAMGEQAAFPGDGERLRRLAEVFDVERVARVAEGIEALRAGGARNVHLHLGLVDLWRRASPVRTD